jgi:hypothetical protein
MLAASTAVAVLRRQAQRPKIGFAFQFRRADTLACRRKAQVALVGDENAKLRSLIK